MSQAEIKASLETLQTNIDWQKDHFKLNDWIYRQQELMDNVPWEFGDDHFIFYKLKEQVDQFFRFFLSQLKYKPKNIMELGMWEGGSLPFWYDLFQPDKLVGIDLQDKEDNAYFKKFLAERGAAEKLHTYWRTNQADAVRLREIIATEYNGPLDLVIDDASHLYGYTKASFETIFPLIRPGGWYIIEDWGWDHWEDSTNRFKFPVNSGLSLLTYELAELVASKCDLVGLYILEGYFVAIERGQGSLPSNEDFKLENFIYNEPYQNLGQASKIPALFEELQLLKLDLIAEHNDNIALREYNETLEKGLQELQTYLKKVESGYLNATSSLANTQRELTALQNSRVIKLANRLSNLFRRNNP
jgi:hypothetical protein